MFASVSYFFTCIIESHKYAPLFCMLALGKTGEGACAQDSDNSSQSPLPTEDRQLGVQCH